MELTEYRTVLLVIGTLLAGLELYDRFVPRTMPCGRCLDWAPGCVKRCSVLARYGKVLRKQQQTRRFLRRVREKLAAFRRGLADSERAQR